MILSAFFAKPLMQLVFQMCSKNKCGNETIVLKSTLMSDMKARWHTNTRFIVNVAGRQLFAELKPDGPLSRWSDTTLTQLKRSFKILRITERINNNACIFRFLEHHATAAQYWTCIRAEFALQAIIRALMGLGQRWNTVAHWFNRHYIYSTFQSIAFSTVARPVIRFISGWRDGSVFRSTAHLARSLRLPPIMSHPSISS